MSTSPTQRTCRAPSARRSSTARSRARQLGEPAAGGAELGRVVSPYSLETVDVITSPVPPGVMTLSPLTVDVVHPGDYGYMIGNLDGAEVEGA